MSQKPLPFSTYPPVGSNPRSPANSAPGSANKLPEPSGQDRRIQAEIEAERLWWSEVSERQVQELESSFEQEFKKTTEKLRSDIARCQDRLELLVESERKQRQGEMAELKREISSLTDNMKGVAERPTIVAGSSVEFVEMRKDIEDLRTVLSARVASIQAEWEQGKTRMNSADAIQGDLRREFMLNQESHQINVTQIEDLRRDLKSLTERVQLMAQSNDEVQQLHQVILQNANTREEDVSAATAAVEKLQTEVDSSRRVLEASDAKIRSELLETLASSCRQLQQSLADEREKRALEANVLRTKLEALQGRLVDSEVMVKAELQKFSQEPPRAAEADEDLRGLVDTLRRDLQKIEADVVNDRAATMGSHDRLRSQMAEGLADERKTCITDIEELRKHLEDMMKRLRQSDNGDAGSRRGNLDSSTGALADSTSIQDLHDLRSELSTLKANVHVIDSECRRSVAASTRVESEMLDLEAQVRKSVALVPRVETVEETCRKFAGVARKVDALETGSRPVNDSDLRQLELEVKHVKHSLHDMVPLASRIDVIEAEVKRGSNNSRLEMAETDIQAIRASMALGVDVSTLQGEMREVAAGLVSIKKAMVEGANRKLSHTVAPQQQPLQQAVRGRSSSVQRAAVRVAAYETRGAVIAAAVEPAQLPLPSLSDDLKNSIENLVYKVNKTLTKPGDQQMAVATTAEAATDELLLQKAVNELRERNLFLREGNAEIVEELLENEGLLTPSSLPEGLALDSHSKASSVIPTPSRQTGMSPQFAIDADQAPQQWLGTLANANRNQAMSQPAFGFQPGSRRGIPNQPAALRQGSPVPPSQLAAGTFISPGRPSVGVGPGRR